MKITLKTLIQDILEAARLADQNLDEITIVRSKDSLEPAVCIIEGRRCLGELPLARGHHYLGVRSAGEWSIAGSQYVEWYLFGANEKADYHLQTDSLPIIRDAKTDWTREISICSPLFALLQASKGMFHDAGFDRCYTVKMWGLGKRTQADAISAFESDTARWFIELSRQTNMAFRLAFGEYSDMPDLEWEELEFDTKVLVVGSPSSSWDMNVVSRFLAAEAHGITHPTFLEYYQVLEYFFYSTIQAESRAQVRATLSGCNGHELSDKDIDRVIHIALKAYRRKKSEKDCLAGLCRRVLANTPDRREFEKLAKACIPLSPDGTVDPGIVAEWIYAHRNAVAHSKGSTEAVDPLMSGDDVSVEVLQSLPAMKYLAYLAIRHHSELPSDST